MAVPLLRPTMQRSTPEIDELAPDHRAVLLLREYHELDYAEIACVLEIQIGTVQSRLSRARAALRLALEDVR
ncbi:MAG TPA: sigma factor-like helix-turn-helix DNA-binding protein [Kofleriaceae bacterium]